jgi:hypothetical protein
MTAKSSVTHMLAELEQLKLEMSKAVPAPLIVYCINDPERRHAGPDEAVIGGLTYLRGAGEDRGSFEARLLSAAHAHGVRGVIAISAEDFGPGPFFDDYWIADPDPTKTIEIGEPTQR